MASKTMPPPPGDGGETIDLNGTLVADVTASGSFDLRQIEATTVGKLLRVLPIATVLIDEALHVVFANHSCEKLGWSVESLRGAELGSLFPEVSTAQEIGDLVREVFLSRTTQTKETTWETDNKRRWGRLTLRPVRMRAERLVLLMVEDMTAEREQIAQGLQYHEYLAGLNIELADAIRAQRAADEALKQSEDRHRHLVESANDAIYATDADGYFTFINPVAERICGYVKGEMIGKHYLEVIHPSYKKQVERFYGIQFVKHLPNTYYEFPVLAKSGETRWMGQSVQLIMEDDSVVGFQAVARDITERREAEEALHERDQLLTTVLAASPVGIGLSIDRRMVWGNEALVSMFGFTEEEYVGKSLRMLYPSDEEFQRVGATIYEGLSSGGTNTIDAKLRKKDGSVFDVTVRLRPVDPSNPSKGHVVAVVDVTERKLAQEQVRQSNETLETVINATSDVVIMVGKDATVHLVNAAGAKSLGSTPREMMGRSLVNYLRPDVALKRRKWFECVIETGKPVRFEDERGEVQFDNLLSPVFDATGQVEAVVGFARDITERKKAETARKESEEKYRAVFDNAAVGIDLVDEQGRFVHVNDTLLNMLGYTEEELGRLNHLDITHPDDREISKRKLDALVGGEVDSYRIEKRYIKKDGSIVWGDLSVSSIHDVEGRYVATIGLVADITDRKKAEAALRESEARFREFAEALPQVVYELDLQGNIIFVNDAGLALGGYVREDLERGVTLKDLVAPEDWEKLFENIRRVIQGEGTSENEYTLMMKDGTRVPIAAYTTPIVRINKVVGLRGVCVDIRRLKEAEEVLMRSREDIEKLVAERTADLEIVNEQLRKEIDRRIRMEEQLAHSEARFRGIFETTPDCIFIKDLFLRYTFVNPAAASCLGMPQSAIIGKNDEELFGAGTAEHFKSLDLRVLKGDVVEDQYTLNVRDSQMILLEIRAPLTDAQGKIVGVCGIARDITERRSLESLSPPVRLKYTSAPMRAAVSAAQLAATTDSTVLLTGESGSGKDYLARYIHERSGRSTGPFYAINCASIPTDLAESELFGHEAGAFTGASKRKRGLLELAEGGTILLNEIGELPLDIQAKLLAFLDTRSFTRVGGEKTVTVNVRLIAATNRDLTKEISEGRFRKDLFYRLDVFAIGVPPLRERLEDLPVLAEEQLSKLVSAFGSARVVRLGSGVVELLRHYGWPGNVRELRNVLERALILSRGGPLKPEHFQFGRPPVQTMLLPASVSVQRPLPDVLSDIERSLIEDALHRSGGNKTDAADLLGISRFALTRHMRKLGLS